MGCFLILLSFKLYEKPIVQGMLSGFTSCNFIAISEIPEDLSGMCYNPETELFYTVRNSTGFEQIYIINKQSEVVGSILLEGFYDTEGITYLGNDTYAIAEERDRRIVFVEINNNTGSSINHPGLGYFEVTDPGLGYNVGFEGLAYDFNADQLYIGKEGGVAGGISYDPKMYLVDSPFSKIGTTINNPTEAFSQFPSCTNGANFDISGLEYTDQNTLLLISEKCELLYELNPQTGAVIATRDYSHFSDPEGVALINSNDLWVVGETNEIENSVVVGATCNDSDDCTINDIYTADCQCAGEYVDADNDGYCIAEDPDDSESCIPDANSSGCNASNDCVLVDLSDFSGEYEFWDIGGGDVALIANGLEQGNQAIRLRDNSGVKSSIFTKNLPLLHVSDIRFSFSFKFESMEMGEDLFFEYSPNAGTDWFVMESWVSGVNVVNNQIYHEDLFVSGVFSEATQFRFRADGSSNYDRVILDDITMEICNVACVQGAPCDDGDGCTLNDAYNANCDCVGTYEDQDQDGVCDFYDECISIPNALIGTSCDDGNECTTGDIYTTDCECSGIYQDQDEDGFCIGDDPDDQDPCVPDANLCNNTCTEIFFDDFNFGWGTWNDGGTDCYLFSAFGTNNSRSLRIRDNSGTSSSAYTDLINLSSYSELKISFSYVVTGMTNGEDFFLELSDDDGDNWVILKSWIAGTDFNLNERKEEVQVFARNFTADSRLRFRSDASSNADRVYLDDVSISGCDPLLANNSNTDFSWAAYLEQINPNDVLSANSVQFNFKNDFSLFPNPSGEKVTLKFDLANDDVKFKSAIYDPTGKLIVSEFIDRAKFKGKHPKLELDVSDFNEGIYYIKISMNDHVSIKKLMIAR